MSSYYKSKSQSLERLTIRDKQEILLIKKAIKLLLDQFQDQLSLDQQMSAIEVYHKTNRTLLTYR